MKNLFAKAHKMTREVKKTYPEVDYKFQFGLCLSFLYQNKEEEKMESAIEKIYENKSKKYDLNGYWIFAEEETIENYPLKRSINFYMDDKKATEPKLELSFRNSFKVKDYLQEKGAKYNSLFKEWVITMDTIEDAINLIDTIYPELQEKHYYFNNVSLKAYMGKRR